MSDLRDEARAVGQRAALRVVGDADTVKLLGLDGTMRRTVEAAVDAVLDMLAPVEDHEVVLDDESFTVIHPLTERAAGNMHECGLHLWLREQGGPPAPPGRYVARRHEHDPTSESFRSDAPPWDLEPIA